MDFKDSNPRTEPFLSRDSVSTSRTHVLLPNLPLRLRLLIIVVVSASFPWLWISSTFNIARHLGIPCSSTPTTPVRAIRYHGEHISWEVCGTIADRPVECSNVDVPMDQFNTSNGAGKTFRVPLIRMRGGKNATKSILLNPGGPGGSGLNFLHRRGVQLHTIIGDGFHLLSFDPRGVNQSVPLADCYPTVEARQALSRVRAKKMIEDSGELWAWATSHGQACADNLGDYAPYMNTPQTAADMNSILDAIGQEDMYYWGFSYGTLLGQTYATLFPNRSSRVIIDGVANQFDWFSSHLDVEFFTDTDKVFFGFVDECIKVGPSKCALAALADNPEELSEKLITSINALRDDPVSVYVNSTVYGILDYWDIWNTAVFGALYRPTTEWYNLASNLASLLQGNATDAFLAYAFSPPNDWNTTGRSDAGEFVMFNDGLSGPDQFPKDRHSFLDLIAPCFNLSMFGNTWFENYFKARAWVVPRVHKYNPVRHGPAVKTRHPLLILSTTYDPVCPLISAKSALEYFQDSRLVEVQGYGHCSVAVPSMCIARHVRDFFYHGKMPEEDHVKCEVDGEPYFVKPKVQGEEGTRTIAEFEDDEEKQIHLAQMELAMDHWIGAGFRAAGRR